VRAGNGADAAEAEDEAVAVDAGSDAADEDLEAVIDVDDVPVPGLDEVADVEMDAEAPAET
jgi:hypothetical protein